MWVHSLKAKPPRVRLRRHVAFALSALKFNTSGHSNVAFGPGALLNNTTGSNYLAIGNNAGSAITGSNNIDIGNSGVGGQSGTLRIGSSGTHAGTYIAGIATTHLIGRSVYVSSSGQPGILVSSERYKTAVAPMGNNTEKLQKLRPVTFRLRAELNGSVQYGLIAEEVDKVYPELVIRDEAGTIQGVRYDELAPVLLNEVQRQYAQLQQQSAELRNMQRQLTELKQMNGAMEAAMATLRANEERVATR